MTTPPQPPQHENQSLWAERPGSKPEPGSALNSLKYDIRKTSLQKQIETRKETNELKETLVAGGAIALLLAIKEAFTKDKPEENKEKESKPEEPVTATRQLSLRPKKAPEKKKAKIDGGLTEEQLLAEVEKTEGLALLKKGTGGPVMEDILKKAKRMQGTKMSITNIKYTPYVHSCVDSLGTRQCARTVGNIMGKGTGIHNWMSVTQNMTPGLIAGNLETTGKTGVNIDKKNWRPGDVLVYTTKGRLSHVSMIMDIVTVEGEKYFAVAHDAEVFRLDFIPFNTHSNKTEWRKLQSKIRTKEGRGELAKKYPKLGPLFKMREKYPEYIKVKNPWDKWARSVQEGGNIAFAIRTMTLKAPRIPKSTDETEIA